MSKTTMASQSSLPMADRGATQPTNPDRPLLHGARAVRHRPDTRAIRCRHSQSRRAGVFARAECSPAIRYHAAFFLARDRVFGHPSNHISTAVCVVCHIRSVRACRYHQHGTPRSGTISRRRCMELGRSVSMTARNHPIRRVSDSEPGGDSLTESTIGAPDAAGAFCPLRGEKIILLAK